MLVEPNLNMSHELLVSKGTMNGVPVSYLIDSGASHNFFSTGLIARVGCTTLQGCHIEDGRESAC